MFSIGVRVLPRLEEIVRRPLAAPGEPLAGLSVGPAQRATARPTAERLLEVLPAVTVTMGEGATHISRPVTALRPLHVRILELLGVSSHG